MPTPRTTSQDVEVAGSFLVILAAAEALKEYSLRSLTEDPPQMPEDMEFCRTQRSAPPTRGLPVGIWELLIIRHSACASVYL